MLTVDYTRDRYGHACLEEAKKSKGKIGFGAILVKKRRIIGRGWNRLSKKYERRMLSHMDYAIHAEQAAIIDALKRGHNVENGTLYVIGKVQAGAQAGKLTTKKRRVFICRDCPHTFLRFDISVCIPMFNGWTSLTPKEAVATAKILCGKHHWKKFVSSRAT